MNAKTWRGEPAAATAGLAAVAALAACRSSMPAAHPAVHATSAPAPMTLLRGCQILRADMTGNGGTADLPTLRQLAAQVPGKLGTQAAEAEKDVGNGNLWWIDAALLSHDCAPAGVQLPG